MGPAIMTRCLCVSPSSPLHHRHLTPQARCAAIHATFPDKTPYRIIKKAIDKSTKVLREAALTPDQKEQDRLRARAARAYERMWVRLRRGCIVHL